MTTVNKEESSQILADCQAKLIEIDHKLTKIKGRCKPGKTQHKYSLHTNEDYIILKKETESLESDIQFVKTLLEDTTEIESSFPLTLMKKVFPMKIFSSQNKLVSNETKAKIIAHSTALLEEKIKVLQNIANSKKKKRKHKPKSRVSDSMCTDISNAVEASKTGASSDSEIIMNPEKKSSLKILSSLKKQQKIPQTLNINSLIEETDLQNSNSDFSKCFTSPNSTFDGTCKNTPSKSENSFLLCSEQHAQTMEVYTSIAVEATEKYVQTDFPLVKWVSSIFNEEQAPSKYLEKGTNTDYIENNDDCLNCPDTVSNSAKLVQDSEPQEILSSIPNNILDMNEIDTIINSLLCSPLKMLQCKHINKLSGENIGNPSGYVNLIIRQSDFMPNLMSGIELKKETLCKEFVHEVIICFPYVYYIKSITSKITIKCDKTRNDTRRKEINYNYFSLDQKSSLSNSNNDKKTKYSIQYNNVEIKKKPHVSNTLQIDYKNSQTSGQIVLTDFGNSQTSTQCEMISRILTHLIDLPNTNEK